MPKTKSQKNAARGPGKKKTNIRTLMRKQATNFTNLNSNNQQPQQQQKEKQHQQPNCIQPLLPGDPLSASLHL